MYVSILANLRWRWDVTIYKICNQTQFTGLPTLNMTLKVKKMNLPGLWYELFLLVNNFLRYSAAVWLRSKRRRISLLTFSHRASQIHTKSDTMLFYLLKWDKQDSWRGTCLTWTDRINEKVNRTELCFISD